ncbi:Terpene synthase, N-terminal domain [Dillenia turbinata]|uniref:Terpene synthase, N-terminal domain n=1 Tax=Dillenia turbinata TaxID=194707 RepID=A0AAN8UXH5_9MAGN
MGFALTQHQNPVAEVVPEGSSSPGLILLNPLSLSLSLSQEETYVEKKRKLEIEVRHLLDDAATDSLTLLELVDAILRLGLGCQFESHVTRALERVASFKQNRENASLHEVALGFRLLRLHGYEVSQDVFKSFVDSQGNFAENLRLDVKGLLSLCEAARAACEGENILDEAKSFTTKHLRELAEESDISLAKYINHSLEKSLIRRIPRLESRWYIEALDREEHAYGMLHELAMLNFNRVQSTLQGDLRDMHKWDINALENLPQYMKLCFLALYNTVNEMAYETLKEHGVDIIQYLTKAWADLCKAFLQEAKWLYDKETPTFEEYFENGWLSVSGCVILVHTYFLASPNITRDALDCLEKYHDILRWPSIIFRLCNDLATSHAELERGESINSISLYMNERGDSEEGARKYLRGIIDETWKKMIKERNNGGSALPKAFIDMAINLARVCHCIYQYGDGHGAPNSRSRKQILSLIIEPVQLEKQHSF